MRLQGATLAEPYVSVSTHTAPIIQSLAHTQVASEKIRLEKISQSSPEL